MKDGHRESEVAGHVGKREQKDLLEEEYCKAGLQWEDNLQPGEETQSHQKARARSGKHKTKNYLYRHRNGRGREAQQKRGRKGLVHVLYRSLLSVDNQGKWLLLAGFMLLAKIFLVPEFLRLRIYVSALHSNMATYKRDRIPGLAHGWGSFPLHALSLGPLC